MFIRLLVTLARHEAEALDRMADEELRDPREQLRMLLREELRRRQLLPSNQSQETSDVQPVNS
jgi:hypothetical protein